MMNSPIEPRNAIEAWGEEKKYYNYDDRSCASGQICDNYKHVSDLNDDSPV